MILLMRSSFSVVATVDSAAQGRKHTSKSGVGKSESHLYLPCCPCLADPARRSSPGGNAPASRSKVERSEARWSAIVRGMAVNHTFLASQFGLDGLRALVIGGTGELCGAMAEGLMQAGAKVAVVGRNPDKARDRLEIWRKAGLDSHFIQGDVSSRAGVEAVWQQAEAELGAVDILVNGAAANSPTPFTRIDDQEFDRIVMANVHSVFWACQTAIRAWLGTQETHYGPNLAALAGQPPLEEPTPPRGCIINLASMSSVQPLSRVFTYSLTKSAVWNLTQNLAREYALAGIRVNAITPGFFPAEQNRAVLTPERVGQIMTHTPMRRFGDKSELIGATLLLASPVAGRFITGTQIIIDGGFSCMSI